VYQHLFERLRPTVFVDPMMGSGTSVEVAREMGIEAYGLDLHQGFNAIHDSILRAVGKPADLCVSHPPYGAMIIYSGKVWGKEAHPDDLSRCATDDEFHEKMQTVLFNQRDATAHGGYYGAIIGDWRRNGTYTSYQSEMISRMPKNELAAVLIKAQHNCRSNVTQYRAMRLPFILHEYIVLWRKKEAPVLVLLGDIARQQQSRLTGTWKSIVRTVLMQLGGTVDLTQLYETVAQAAPERLALNGTWREKVRQTLSRNPALFRPMGNGVWSLA